MELLVATFILVLTLTTVIAVFISGRAGIVESWERTQQSDCAAYIIEQLKSTPYTNLVELESHYRKNGVAKEIKITNTTISLKKDNQCSDVADVQLDLRSYMTFPIEEMMEVKVRVRKDNTDEWVEKGSLFRKGE